jgi:plasmid rolling circle replication initiator protein Rep
MWKQSLRIEYDPIIHIQLVKNKKGKAPIENPNEIENDQSGMIKGICETLKYTVKENDLVGKFCEDDDVNSNWLKTITQELYKLRRVDYGGVLKEFGKEAEKSMEDLIEIEEKEENGMEENGMERIAEWNFHLKAYIMRGV